jgi:hypothetical protein
VLKSFFIYFFIFLITSIFAEISSKVKSKAIKIPFITITLFIPAFFAGIRYGIGTDYFAYVRVFNKIAAGIPVRTEFGFNFLNKIVGNFGGNEQIVFFIMSFLTILIAVLLK